MGQHVIRFAPRRPLRACAIALALFGAACQGGPISSGVSPTPSVRYTPIPTETPSSTPTPVARPTAAPTPPPDWNAQPKVAEDPAGVAQQLTVALRAIHDPAVTGAQLTWMGHLEQLAISTVNDFPEWKTQVLAAIPDDLRATAAGTLEAGRQIRQIQGPTPKTLPEWTILDPAPLPDLLSFYKEAEAQYGIPWYYLAAINLLESRMGRIHGDSIVGAQGPMQFMPATWAAYGQGDVNDPHAAILGAARYLKAAGAPSDMPRALLAYNHSLPYANAISLYAEVMKADPDAIRGYYGWQVYYTTVDGTTWLKVGWHKE